MIHIYTGNGKGKTTSSFGLAMRASGQGLKVIIFQFLKPKSLVTGEEISAKKIKNLKIVKYEQSHPMFNAGADVKKSIKKAMTEAKKAIFSKRYNMVILDEIINVLDQGFAEKKDFLELIKKAPKDVELVFTGRGDISDIEQFADYVTIMIDKKHPFRQRVNARRGIEY
ncbi:MAG: cob(I)yrinic acid a,c-diamide adenosyltransferase [Candidatus Omnitrophica bacterium CG02_land_8_20_14_3_00__42_8]|nr:MAG: cob(I)yrinic acid a,c-diamide adenosyltransferase [Candidatus Omnitrophica bacterium CG02_land_8_20_14_3_00__42_8]PIW68155.1 MAG: cob(I)yrinic acid a,c-diamide adenosyltransferase [Candidatus Omnitrophica bacterium CG12_big_fil_rev_8_21_14_0_65_42_8]